MCYGVESGLSMVLWMYCKATHHVVDECHFSARLCSSDSRPQSFVKPDSILSEAIYGSRDLILLLASVGQGAAGDDGVR